MPAKISEMQSLLEKLIVDGRSTPGAVQKNDVEVVRYPRAEAPKQRGETPARKGAQKK
jgi:hypothetical protein